MIHEFIRKRIQQLMTRSDISAIKLSEKIGKSDSYINKILNDKSKMSIGALEEICNVLNISLAEFFLVENDKDASITMLSDELDRLFSYDDILYLLEMFRQLDEDAAKKLLDALRILKND